MNECLVANNIMELIGKTPMIKIQKILPEGAAEVYAKLEWYNVGSSVKDRMALRLIENAEKDGRLNGGKIILEATSGNTGIALAMIAAAKGHKIEIVMPECASIERRAIIRAYGAKLVLSPGTKCTGGAIELKRQMLRESPEKYIDMGQFKDPANIEAHHDTTAAEIIEQTDGKLDMVVIGIGTAGTGVGISKKLRENNINAKIVGIVPEQGSIIQGLRNPNDFCPTQLYDRKSFDEIVEIKKDELSKTFDAARDLAGKEGLLVGMSAAAAMYVARKKAIKLGARKRIVVIFPDNGFKYLSTPLFGMAQYVQMHARRV